MSQTIPTLPDAPFHTLRARLDGAEFLLELLYNTRTRRWYLNVFSEDEVPLVRGLKCVPNVPLLRAYHFRAGVPAGELMITCAGGETRPPLLGELGADRRCQLTYFPRAEVLELLEAAQAEE
jgi:hypothetical protein